MPTQITDDLLIKPVRAITLRAPWSDLTALRIKGIENRSWNTNYRGLVLVHSGLAVDRRAFSDAHVAVALAADYDPEANAGRVVALAELIDVHKDAECCRPWGDAGAYHFVWGDIVPLPRPVRTRGYQQLWVPKADLLLGILAETARAQRTVV